MSTETPPDDPSDSDGPFVWVLFEDGSLRPVVRDAPNPRFQTDAQGRRWLKLAQEVPIAPVIPSVEVATPAARWREAPDDASRQWQARPFSKPVSMLTAALILVRNLFVRHDECRSQLDDIEALVRGGHAAKALTRLEQFNEDWPDYRPGTLGLAALAQYDLGHEERARELHAAACLQASMHPAMIEVFGIPDLAGAALRDPDDDLDEPPR